MFVVLSNQDNRIENIDTNQTTSTYHPKFCSKFRSKFHSKFCPKFYSEFRSKFRSKINYEFCSKICSNFRSKTDIVPSVSNSLHRRLKTVVK